MAAPIFVAEYESAWNTNTTPKTVSATVAANDVLVVCGMTADQTTTLATPTGGSLTYTLRQSVVVNNFGAAYQWTAAPGSAQTFTLSDARAGSANLFGFNALRFSGSAGIGASSKANSATGNAQVTLTTTQANSAIVVCIVDWNAVDGTSRAWNTATAGAATEQSYFRNTTDYAIYVAVYQNAGAAGSKTVGLTAPSGTKYSIIAVEVLGSSGQTVTATGIPSGEVHGTATVTPAPATVAPSAVASGEVLGTAAVTAAPVQLAPVGIPSGEAPGTPAVTPTPATVAAVGVASAEALGQPTVTPTPATIAAAGVASSAAVGSATVTSAAATVSPSGIASGEVVPGPSVVPAAATVSPAGVVSGEQVGTPSAIPTPVTVSPGGIASSEAVPAPAVSAQAPVNLAAQALDASLAVATLDTALSVATVDAAVIVDPQAATTSPEVPEGPDATVTVGTLAATVTVADTVALSPPELDTLAATVDTRGT